MSAPAAGWVRQAAAQVDLEALREVVVARCTAAAFADLADDAEFTERLRASVAENLRALRDVLCGAVELADVHVTEPVAFGAVQARLRVPQTSLQRSYRVSFMTMWEEWARQLRLAAERGGVPREEALLGLEHLTAQILRYQDHVASRVAEHHARADDALNRSRAHVRHGLVRQVLREDAQPLSPSDQLLLDHPLDAWHVAVRLPGVAEGAAAQLAPGLRAAARARAVLVHPVDLSSTVVWLAAPAGWSDGSARPALASVADKLVSLDVEASVSDALAGVEGFRATWHQVQEVEQVRRALGRDRAPRLLRHADVALEVLLLRDPRRARRFVEAELGPLAEDGAQAERLRDTLEASYRWGSHTATAEHLHLHEHTVRNRLQKAEQQLGRSLQHRRTELQVALRLLRLLGGPAPGSDAH